MDDRPHIADSAGDPPRAPVVIVVHPPGHRIALAVVDRLKETGCRVHPADSVYQAVVDIARGPQQFAAAVLAVDFFNREELRFFPMAGRRWPSLWTAAVARPGFAYKAAIAELAGADAICTDAGRAGEMVARLDLSPGTPEADPQRKNAPARPAPPPLPSAPQSAAPETIARGPAPPPPAARSQSPGAAGQDRRPAQKAPSRRPPKPPVAPHDILTEEEIRALMAEIDDDEPSPHEGADD